MDGWMDDMQRVDARYVEGGWMEGGMNAWLGNINRRC